MANPELGTKRICPETGRKFYDLNKDPIVSPYTGTSYPVSFFEIPARPKRGAAAVAPEEAVVEKTEDAEEEEDAPEVVSLTDVEEEEDAPVKKDSIDVDDDEDEEVEADDSDTFLEADEDEDDDVTDIIGARDDDDD